MTVHDYAATLTRIRQATIELEAREAMSGRERIELWQDVRDARDDLDVILRDLETDATEALAELLRETDEDELATDLGAVHLGQTTPTEHWRGYDLLGKLSTVVAPIEVARETGEIVAGEPIRAVPLDVLREVVAGCVDESKTSSAWRKTGLRQYVDDVRQWYDVVREARPVIRKGVAR